MQWLVVTLLLLAPPIAPSPTAHRVQGITIAVQVTPLAPKPIEPSKPVLEYRVDFWTSPVDCLPCRLIEPEIAALVEEGWPIERIDYQAYREAAADYGVPPYPQLIAYRRPRGDRLYVELGRLVGYNQREAVRKWLIGLGVRPQPRGD